MPKVVRGEFREDAPPERCGHTHRRLGRDDQCPAQGDAQAWVRIILGASWGAQGRGIGESVGERRSNWFLVGLFGG